MFQESCIAIIIFILFLSCINSEPSQCPSKVIDFLAARRCQRPLRVQPSRGWKDVIKSGWVGEAWERREALRKWRHIPPLAFWLVLLDEPTTIIYVPCQDYREERVKTKTFASSTNQACFCSLPIDVHAILSSLMFLEQTSGLSLPFPQYLMEKGLELSSCFSPKGTFSSNFQLLFKATSLPPRKPCA